MSRQATVLGGTSEGGMAHRMLARQRQLHLRQQRQHADGHVRRPTTTLAYSYENWLTQITYPNQTTNTFQYDGNGIRYSKTDSAGTLRYVRDGNGLLAELDGTNALVAAYTGGASVRRNGVSSFFHHDGLGSTRQLTNAAGTLTDAYSYDSFGNVTGQTGTTFNPSKYVGSLGYYADGDSGLMLLQHRYYDPGAGRFITLDPIKDGVNWYTYCGNDPVNGVDPQGLKTDDEKLETYCLIGLGIVAAACAPAAPLYIPVLVATCAAGAGAMNQWPPSE